MEKQSFKSMFSFSNLFERLSVVWNRFPIATILLLALTVLLGVCVEKDDITKTEGVLIYFFSVGFLLDCVITLWCEDGVDKKLYYVGKGFILLVWAAYCLRLIFVDEIPTDNIGFLIGNATLIVCFILFFPIVPFLRECDDVKMWHFTGKILAAFLISCVVAFLLCGGLILLLVGIIELFQFNPSDEVLVTICILCGLLIPGLLFLSLIPYKEQKNYHFTEIPKVFRTIVVYVLLPLLGLYMLILYIYAFYILFTFELPKGMLSVLVTIVMVGYLLCYFVLYPSVKDSDSMLSKLLTRWIPIAIFPLLVLMSVGVVRRFMDYGITAPRLYLLTLLLWYYAVCIFVLIYRQRPFTRIVLSFALLFIITSAHPFNYYYISEKIITRQIQRVFDQYNLELPLSSISEVKMVLTEYVGENEAQKIYDKIWYVRDTYGYDAISQWVKSFASYHNADNDDQEYKSTYREIAAYYIPPYLETHKYDCPQGNYASFRPIESYAYDIPYSDIKDGIIPVVYRPKDDNVTLLIDTVAVQRAISDATTLFVKTNSDAVFVARKVTISVSDSVLSVSYDGYLFDK